MVTLLRAGYAVHARKWSRALTVKELLPWIGQVTSGNIKHYNTTIFNVIISCGRWSLRVCSVVTALLKK